MVDKINLYLRYTIGLFLAIFVLCRCANMASPSGGPYDEAPPKVRRSSPYLNALNVNQKKIVIEFDENIKIDKPSEKVIITPPQKNLPIIKSIGRKALIELDDDLIPNTTYVIDFTDAIVDNNEDNPLENFAVSFSTGDQLDTLQVSGTVLTADNLEPVTGISVGLHSNLNDTAFTNIAFEKISRTNSHGKFVLKGLAPGKYHIFALNDRVRTYKYDDPQSEIAFLDSVIIPSFGPAVRMDTIFKDSLTIDTIRQISYTRFMPDDIVLRTFSSEFRRLYLLKYTRPERKKIQLLFSAPIDMPTFSLVSPNRNDNNWYVMERNATNDTLTLWLTDSLVYKSDTLSLKLNYLKTDTLNKNFLSTDTLSLKFKDPKKSKKEIKKEEAEKLAKKKEPEKKKSKKKKNAKSENKNNQSEQASDSENNPLEQNEEAPEDKNVYLSVNTNIKSSFDIYQSIFINIGEPALKIDTSAIKLYRAVDSVFNQVEYKFIADTLSPLSFTLKHKWEPGVKYKLVVDSASIVSYFGLHNNKLQNEFTVKNLDQYGDLRFTISGLPEGKTAYVELLDKSDKPFRKKVVKDNEVTFFDLNPAVIYARLFIDDNGDGEWTTGDYNKHRLPEEVYYYPRSYEIRAYVSAEEPWNILDKPINQQKPSDITKNKPEEKRKKSKNAEREKERQNNQQYNNRQNRQGSQDRNSPRTQGFGAMNR